jgi:CHAT domain-containing protein
MFSTVLIGRSLIHLFDLFQLRVDADLVTVSGWSPGHRADAKGNEMVGLVRGLLYAGARAVLTGLWPVDDDVWVGLADEFYRGVREGNSFERSLRRAITALRTSDSDPRVWAPFVLFGDAS